MASATNKDIVLVVSLVLSVVNLVLLFGVTWYFQSSLDLLQQEVEYDRELLFKLQEQINGKYNNDTINKQDILHVVKRQSEQNCKCKDGIPGPPGNKGEKGMEGKQGRKGDTGPQGAKGNTGNQGPQGSIGPMGLPGNKGEMGHKGDIGPPGKRGNRGPTGLTGNKGEMGVNGDTGPQGAKGNSGNQGPQGSTGPMGPPGNKGEMGHKGDIGPPGPRGDAGDRGPRGRIGDPGYIGLPGPKGIQGNIGDPGVRGPRGLTGDTGLRGPVGEAGIPGAKGAKGEKGSPGTRGEKSNSGSPGSTGLAGSKGAPGQKGMKGDNEERNEGTVYVRWGHDQCPSTTQLVYSGRAGGSDNAESGGGSNPQCLPLDPQYLTPISGVQHRGYMYGGRYKTHTDSNSHVHGREGTSIPCAVCHVSNRTAVYMVPAKYTCPTGWTREYYGYLMSQYHIHPGKSQFTCIDNAFKPVPVSNPRKYPAMFLYFVEGRCGVLPCPPYDNTRELSCAVCTK